MQAKVSVIIASRNSGTPLIESVHAALASSVAVEVIVSDRGSTDFSIEPLVDLAATDARLRVLRHDRDPGFARACNAALAKAEARYVLFLRPGCLVQRDAVKRALAALDAHPAAALAGAADGRRRAPQPREAWRHPGALRELGRVAAPLPPVPQAVEAVSSEFMLVRREALERLGAFDERYAERWEDVDLCLRARDAGFEVLCVPEAEARGANHGDSRALRAEWREHADLLRFFRRHFFAGARLPLLLPVAAAIGLGFLLRAVMPRRADAAHSPAASAGDSEVWVFGASSMIGHHLLPRLVAAGYRVRAFSRDPQRAGVADSARLAWQRFDIESGAPLPAAAGMPEIVIHLAPLALLPRQLDALAARGMRSVIAFGTTSRFTKRRSSHPKERRLVADLDEAEQRIESTCARLGVEWTVFRPTLIYSFGRDRNVSRLAGFIRWFGFFLMPGEGRGLRQPVHADDLAKACVALLAGRRGWNRAYNLSGGETLTYRAMVRLIFVKLKRHELILCVPTWCWRVLLRLAHLLPAYRDINLDMIQRVNADLCFDHTDATREFGFAPRRFQP